MTTAAFKSVLVIAATLSFASTAPGQTVLFSDNFNRANNDVLSAETTGMAGTLAPLNYLETWQAGNPGNASILQINNNTLSKIGTGMGIGALDHNFTDAAILAGGGFRVAMDVTVGTSGDDLPDRYGGFGGGLSLAEVNGFQDENDTDFGPRGTISNVGSQVDQDLYGHTGVADFYISLSLQNNLQIFKGGLLEGQYAVTPAANRTVEVEFSFADFNAGSKVNFAVWFEGAPVTGSFFNWSGTDQNFLGFSLRSSTVVIDNLTISAIPEPSSLALLALGAGLWIALRRQAP